MKHNQWIRHPAALFAVMVIALTASGCANFWGPGAEESSTIEVRGTERGLVLTLGDVLFGFGRVELTKNGEREVAKLSDYLKRHPKRNVVIEGFTDSVGSIDYNMGLSERRASAVRTSLINNGIDPDRVHSRGYGESFPVATNATDAGRQQNRRVEIVISDEDGMIPPRRS